MKQTNNAIKFLVAQYRAIFKNAYVKGIATALVLTTGLAVGQAQAGAGDAVFDATDDIGAKGPVIEITGQSGDKGTDSKFSSIAIVGVKGQTFSFTGDPKVTTLKITGGAASANSFAAGTSDAALTFNGAGTNLVIEGTDADISKTGLTISGTAGGAATVTFDNITVSKGTLKVSEAATGDATLSAVADGVISIGKVAVADDTKPKAASTLDAVVELGASIGTKTATLGAATNTIELNKTGKIVFGGSGSTATSGAALAILDGAKLTGDGGTLIFSGSTDPFKNSGTIKTPNYYVGGAVSKAPLNIVIGKGNAAVVDLNKSGTALGVLHLASGSVIDIESNATNGNTLAIGTSKSGSVVVIDEGVTLTSKASNDPTPIAGAITVTGDASSNSELQIAGSVLESFLKADEVKTFDVANNKVSETATTDAAGSVTLTNSKLVVNTNKTVVLGDALASDENTLTLGIADAAAAGKVAVTTAGTIAADKVSLAKKISATTAPSILSIEAKELSLGSDAAKSTELAFKSATVSKSLSLTAGSADNGVFTLASGVVLNGEGSVTGSDLLLSGSKSILTAQAGNWTVEQGLTISGGKLDVAASGNDVQATLSSLVLAKADGTVNVTGAQGYDATLVLAGDNVTFNTDTSKANTITVAGNVDTTTNKGYGTLKTDSAFLDGYKDSKDKLVIATGGVVEVEGSVNLDASKLATGKANAAVAGSVNFDGDKAGGKLAVNGDLRLTGASVSVSGGTLAANNIILQHDAEVNVAAGNLVASTGFSSAKGVKLGGSNVATLTLNGTSGYINGNLATDASSIDGTAINVVSGTWSASNDITLGGSGSLTLGSDKGGATLTVEGNLSNSGGTANVLTLQSGSTLNLTTVQLTDKATVNVNSGSKVNIIGDKDSEVSGSLAGVNLSGATVKVQTGSCFALGQDVLNAAVNVDASGNLAGLNEGLKAKYDVSAGGEILLDGTLQDSKGNALSLNADELKALKDSLIEGTGFNGTLNIGDNSVDVKWAKEDKSEILWSEFEPFANVESVTSNDFKQATATEIDAVNTQVIGNIGALQAKADTTATSFTAKGSVGLHDAETVGTTKYYAFKTDASGNTTAMGITNSTGGGLVLAGGGHIGSIKFSGNASGDIVVQGGGTTVVDGNVEAVGNFVVGADTIVNIAGDTKSAKGDLKVTTGGVSNSGTLQVANKADINGAVKNTGTFQIANNATFKDAVNNQGTLEVGKDATFTGAFKSFTGSKTAVTGALKLNGDNEIAGSVTAKSVALATGKSLELVGGKLVTDALTLADNTGVVTVGKIGNAEATNVEGAVYDKTKSYGGTLFTKQLSLKGGVLYLDPAYGQESSYAIATSLAANGTVNNKLDGSFVVGQNAVLGLGFETESDLYDAVSFLQDSNKSLSADKYGSVVAFDGANGVVIDASAANTTNGIALFAKDLKSFVNYYNANNAASATDITYVDGDEKQTLNNIKTAFAKQIYLGANSALVATSEAANATLGQTAKGLITFTGSTNDKGTVIADGGDVVVAGDVRVGSSYKLFDNANITYINGDPYAAQTDKANANYKNNIDILTVNGFLSGVVAADGTAQLGLASDARERMSGASNPAYETLVAYVQGYHGTDTNDVLVDNSADEDNNEATYSNAALQAIVSRGNGGDLDRIARAGAFTGVAHATVAAGSTTASAIGARFGLGSSVDVNTAANNNGGAMFVAPI